MSVEAELLARAGLTKPDGRPLFAWNCDEHQRRRLAQDLTLSIAISPAHPITAARFVLWAAEEIRAHHKPGHLTWEWLFGRLERRAGGNLGRDLTERGLAWWGRAVRVSQSGMRQFLYSLMAEGGLPDAYLAEAPRYRTAMLGMLAEIEAEGALGETAAERVAWRRVGDLPHAFRNEDTVLLFAELSLCLARLRARLPIDLPAQAAEAWLDRQVPGWRQELPLRLSREALDALIRPALRAARGGAAQPTGPHWRRELRRRVDGGGWAGCAVIAEGALLGTRFLPGVESDRRLRLIALGEGGRSEVAFLGVPETGAGWRLVRVGGRGEAALLLPPDQALVLAAYADGRPVGEAVVDPGLPPPAAAPTFWRGRDANDAHPSVLEPLSGAARTRASWLWLLAGPDEEPLAGDGVAVDEPEPAPGGCLWPILGYGTIIVAGCELSVATEAEGEAPVHRLHLFGRLLPRWRCDDGQLCFVGYPEIWGAEDDGVLRRLNTYISTRPVAKRLGGQIAEWRKGAAIVARATFHVLPDGAHLKLAETTPGGVCLQVEGLRPCWHVRLAASGAEAAAQVAADGRVTLDLVVPGQPPASLGLRLSDPASGAVLALRAPWPARYGMFVAPDGTRVVKDQTVAVGALIGWRGIVPDRQPGSLLIRVGNGSQLGLPVEGEVRLAAVEPLARLLLGLGGLDASVQLNLVVGGVEGRRLTIKRYAEERFKEGYFHGGDGRWCLHAVALEPPGEVRTKHDVLDEFDVAGWLSDSAALWLIQARDESGEAARPRVWSSARRPSSTREKRISGYAEAWRRLLATPDDQAWQELWNLIRAAREGGDAGALDQVQALCEVPAAAVALLLRVPEVELAEALALEAAAPLWWPATPLAAWVAGIAIEIGRLRQALLAADFSSEEAVSLAGEALAHRAAAILALRPELRGHLGAGFCCNELEPVAQGAKWANGRILLAYPSPREWLGDLAQEVARRDPPLPEGAAQLRRARLSLAGDLPDHLRPLLDAPLVAAEVAVGEAPRADIRNLIQLIVLRHADPHWFDAALPAAVQLYVEDVPQ